MSVLEALGLWKNFGATIALRDVSLSLDKGFHVIAGPNGSGKTTLLKIWAGLLRPSRGSVRTLGLNPWIERSRVLRRVHVAFEDINLPWWTTGLDYLKHVAYTRGIKWSEVVELAEVMGVTGYWSKGIRGYSSGMRKKVLLLQALIGEPEVLILDEPYTLLDSRSATTLQEIIWGKVKMGVTVVIATHIFTNLEDRADTLTVLRNGIVIAHHNVNELRETARVVCEDRDVVSEIAGSIAGSVERVIVEEGSIALIARYEGLKRDLLERCRREVNLRSVYERELARSP